MEGIRKIEVVPYNPDWASDFNAEAGIIRGVLKGELISIHHIGSTSIPNLAAKPVIDILAEVRNIQKIDCQNDSFTEFGYIPQGEYGISARRFFIKGIYERTHHLHVFKTGNPEIVRHIAFRDYMIANPLEAKQYEILKLTLAARFPRDIEGYCRGKDAYIKSIEQKIQQEKFRAGINMGI